MRFVKILLKFVFICNLCYLAVWLLRITEHGERFAWLFNSVIVLGILVAPWANMLSSVLAIVLLLLRKISWGELPGYLLILNLSILLVQILV